MLRAVFDPGVLVAALLSSRGAPARLLVLWMEGAFELIASPRLVAELRTVLAREKFRTYVTQEEANGCVAMLERLAILVRDPEDVPRVSRDPDDDYLVALAGSAGVTVLVSGDPHPTEIEGPPAVMTPRQLLDRISRSIVEPT